MVETAEAASLKLTPRLELELARRLHQQQQERHWHGGLPVLLLDRCLLQLRAAPARRATSATAAAVSAPLGAAGQI